jgi:hypothetical protein
MAGHGRAGNGGYERPKRCQGFQEAVKGVGLFRHSQVSA